MLSDKDSTLHFDPIRCYGCEKLFGMTVKDADIESQKYCENCFGHKFPLNDYMYVLSQLNPVEIELWKTPVSELNPEIKKFVKFVNTELND